MRLNPFGHIQTKGFVNQTLRRRFSDAARVIGLHHPVLVYLMIENVINNGWGVYVELGLLHYLFAGIAAIASIPAAILCSPGLLSLFIASRFDDTRRYPNVTEAFRYVAIGLLAIAIIPALIIEAVALIATVIAAYVTGLALMVIATPFILATHGFCKLYNLLESCFTPAIGEDKPSYASVIDTDKSFDPDLSAGTSTHYDAASTMHYAPDKLSFADEADLRDAPSGLVIVDAEKPKDQIGLDVLDVEIEKNVLNQATAIGNPMQGPQ